MTPLKRSAQHRHQESKLPAGNHLRNRLFLRARRGERREKIYDSAALSGPLAATAIFLTEAFSQLMMCFIKTRTLMSLALCW